jgi:hypothetical protein
MTDPRAGVSISSFVAARYRAWNWCGCRWRRLPPWNTSSGTSVRHIVHECPGAWTRYTACGRPALRGVDPLSLCCNCALESKPPAPPITLPVTERPLPCCRSFSRLCVCVLAVVQQSDHRSRSSPPTSTPTPQPAHSGRSLRSRRRPAVSG